ncbi:hypothetical protein K5N30_002730 [Vibrio parahaemolyticus]|nr:hypothetical protein [Vibrio parahaemolyticus]
MPKSKQQKLDEYYKNRNHVVGSEAWLTDEELATKRRIEELEDPNHPHNSEANKAARKRKLDELMGKSVKSYRDMRG